MRGRRYDFGGQSASMESKHEIEKDSQATENRWRHTKSPNEKDPKHEPPREKT